MRANLERLQLEIYGTSHAPEIGVKLGGLPVGKFISADCADVALARRRSVAEVWSTPRKEADEVVFSEGLVRRGDRYEITGSIRASIANSNVRPSDYSLSVPRPSHADYVAYMRDGVIESGGGRFSGRMTAPLCVAGGIAEDLLRQIGIQVVAYVSHIGGVTLGSYKDLGAPGEEEAARIKREVFPARGDRSQAVALIKDAAANGDSVGGAVECVVSGVKAGALGEAMQEGLESKIAYCVFGVPAVKGIEFGYGFDLAAMRGSNANDAFCLRDGNVETLTNRSGGINGGISNGMPITLRVALRPTPSISLTQDSVDLVKSTSCKIEIKGRHDACIVPRAAVCIESAVALAILDEALKYGLLK